MDTGKKLSTTDTNDLNSEKSELKYGPADLGFIKFRLRKTINVAKYLF